MKLTPEALITVFSDSTALLLILGLLTLSDRNRKDYEDRSFFMMCVDVLVLTVFNAACYVFTGRDVEKFGRAAIILYSVSALFTVFFVCRWITYMDYQIYRNEDHIKRRYKILNIMVIFIFAALVVNIFTGYLFSVDEYLYIIRFRPFFALSMLQLAGFLYPGYEIWRYSKKNRVLFFYKSWPILVPILLNVAVSLTTWYSVGSICFACAVVFLYFFMMNRWRFVDDGSGFYNTEYLGFLKRMVSEGKRQYKYILVFKGQDSSDELCRILKKELPPKGEIIRQSEKVFLLPAVITNKSILKSMGEMVEVDVSEYDSKNPDKKIALKTAIEPFDSYVITED